MSFILATLTARASLNFNIKFVNSALHIKYKVLLLRTNLGIVNTGKTGMHGVGRGNALSLCVVDNSAAASVSSARVLRMGMKQIKCIICTP